MGKFMNCSTLLRTSDSYYDFQLGVALVDSITMLGASTYMTVSASLPMTFRVTLIKHRSCSIELRKERPPISLHRIARGWAMQPISTVTSGSGTPDARFLAIRALKRCNTYDTKLLIRSFIWRSTGYNHTRVFYSHRKGTIYSFFTAFDELSSWVQSPRPAVGQYDRMGELVFWMVSPCL